MNTKVATLPKPSGTVIETTELGEEIFRDTIQCVSCQCHFVWDKDTKKVIDWSWSLDGPVCRRCHQNPAGPVWWERQLDNIEHGRDRRDTSVKTPKGIYLP